VRLGVEPQAQGDIEPGVALEGARRLARVPGALEIVRGGQEACGGAGMTLFGQTPGREVEPLLVGGQRPQRTIIEWLGPCLHGYSGEPAQNHNPAERHAGTR
jgi:hypothetical protein